MNISTIQKLLNYYNATMYMNVLCEPVLTCWYQCTTIVEGAVRYGTCDYRIEGTDKIEKVLEIMLEYYKTIN